VSKEALSAMARLVCFALVLALCHAKSVTREDLPELANVLNLTLGEREDLRQAVELQALFDEDGRKERISDVFRSFADSASKKSAQMSHQRLQKALLRTKHDHTERGLGELNVCVWCDKRCRDQITAAGFSKSEYFSQVMGHLNTMVGDLDPEIQLTMAYLVNFRADATGTYFAAYPDLDPADEPEGYTFEMSWYTGSNLHDVDQLTHINDAFWDGQQLYSAMTPPCDIDYWIGSSSDSVWRTLGGIEGIANMDSMCLSSYMTVKQSSDPVSMAQIMAHELGHTVGIYHDDEGVNNWFIQNARYFDEGQMLSACSEEYSAITDSCHGGSDCGCDDEAGYMFMGEFKHMCLMNSVVFGSTYSDCSRAYYDMFLCLSDIMPYYYSQACADN